MILVDQMFSIWGFAFTFILHLNTSNQSGNAETELKSEFWAGVEVSGGSDVTWIGFPQGGGGRQVGVCCW